MFTVTRDWIMQHRTPRQSWRRAQLEAIGVHWSPTAGWIDRIVGTRISDEQRQTFEQERVKQKPEQQGLFDQGQFA